MPCRPCAPRIARSLFLSSTLLVALLLVAPPLQAAEIFVNTTSDSIVDNDGRCALREAVAAANADMALHGCSAGDGPDTIVLGSADYTMAVAGANEDGNLTGDFDIVDDLTIRPTDGISLVRIDAAGLDRIFDVRGGVSLTLERLELRGGDVLGFGGAIVTFDPATLLSVRNCVISNNTASIFGGGIAADGPTEVVDSFIFNNEAAIGGGIHLFGDNRLVVVRSEVTSNSVNSDGGGIWGARMFIVESSISENRADRDGGGIFLRDDGGPADSQIINSTIAFNEADQNGGGLYVNFLGNLDLFNATVGYNTADNNSNDIGDGGGIFVVGGTVRPRHTIFGANVDGSAAGLRAPDCSGPVVSAGRNLFSAIDFAVCQTSGDFASDLVGSLGGPLDPGLEPCLEAPDDSNTSALNVLDDSPAVDAGDPAGCLAFGGAPLENDQAGNQRVWDGPDLDDVARCDLGAIELGAPSASFIFGDDFESGNLSAWTAIVPPPPGLLTQGPPKTPRQIFRESVPLRGGCGGGDA